MSDQPLTGFSVSTSQEVIRKQISTLSHSMRTPLATCQSFLNILQMGDYKLNGGEVETLAHEVQDTIEKALVQIQADIMQLRDMLGIE